MTKVPVTSKPTPLGVSEFPLFPHKLWRPHHPIFEHSLDARYFKDPWAKREAWRYSSFFSTRNRARNFAPGLGLGLLWFGLYVAYDNWYNTSGPGKEENQKWAEWKKERDARLGLDHHHH